MFLGMRFGVAGPKILMKAKFWAASWIARTLLLARMESYRALWLGLTELRWEVVVITICFETYMIKVDGKVCPFC